MKIIIIKRLLSVGYKYIQVVFGPESTEMIFFYFMKIFDLRSALEVLINSRVEWNRTSSRKGNNPRNFGQINTEWMTLFVVEL